MISESRPPFWQPFNPDKRTCIEFCPHLLTVHILGVNVNPDRKRFRCLGVETAIFNLCLAFFTSVLSRHITDDASLAWTRREHYYQIVLFCESYQLLQTILMITTNVCLYAVIYLPIFYSAASFSDSSNELFLKNQVIYEK